MALEMARVELVPKPWGSTDLLPWSEAGHGDAAIGELWFERSDPTAPEPALLLKLLFTREMLSIQVHPDDAFAQAMGLPRGKTEAWYILSATPGATVGIGLTSVLTAPQLRAAIADGWIARLVKWRKALKGDVIAVPAGTIHAIGPGLVLAEIQQRSDTTFRLFDHGRARELHIEQGVAAAHARPAESQSVPQRVSDARTVLVTTAHFVLERFDLEPGSAWDLDAKQETWLVVIAGDAQCGLLQLGVGQGCFAEAQTIRVVAGRDGSSCLAAYAAAIPRRDFLRPVETTDAQAPGGAATLPVAPLSILAKSPIPFTEARS